MATHIDLECPVILLHLWPPTHTPLSLEHSGTTTQKQALTHSVDADADADAGAEAG